MLVVQVYGVAHPARRQQRRRVRAKPVASPAEPETVPLSRVTIARTEAFEDAADAQRWLKDVAGSPKARADEAAAALALINRALGALRDAAEDPLVNDVALTRALSIRVGYGSGEQIADGTWTEARQLPDPPPPRHLELDPQHAVAEALAKRKPGASRESS